MPSFELFVDGLDVEIRDVIREIGDFFTIKELGCTHIDMFKDAKYIAFHHGEF